MTNEQRYVIALLRKALGVEAEYENAPVDMRQVLNIIGRNGILLTVYHALPEQIKQGLKSNYLVFVRQHILQEYEGERVLDSLSAEGLDCIALKGWELFKLYPDSAMRQMADLDVLVKPYDFDRVKKVMRRLNYQCNSESSWKHDNFIKNVVLVEMHKRLTDDSGKIQSWEEQMWSRAVKVKDNIFRMSNEDYYIFHFVHLHKDFMNGSLGFRRIADTWLLNRRKDMDMDFVRTVLTEFGMWEFHERMVELSKAVMGEAEMDESMEFLLDHASAHGIYGSSKSYKAGRIAAMGKNVKAGKRRSTLAAVFLPYSRMKAQFPVLKKYPFLLPWCWMKRIVRSLKGDIKTSRKMLNYTDIGEEEFNEMKKFFENGGVWQQTGRDGKK